MMNTSSQFIIIMLITYIIVINFINKVNIERVKKIAGAYALIEVLYFFVIVFLLFLL